MFLYEMHQHTAGCSLCASISPDEAVRQLWQAGFSGMVLTNHINMPRRPTQSWADYVRPYEQAYRQAKAEGDRLDFDVLFGIELHLGGGKEVLLYGITPEWLVDHPEIWEPYPSQTAHLQAVVNAVREVDGLVFQAHPFRVRDYISDPWKPLPPALLDGVEGYNFCNSPLENARAVQFAAEHDLPLIAGTDAHHPDIPGHYGIAVDWRLYTEQDLTATLDAGAYTLYIPD